MDRVVVSRYLQPTRSAAFALLWLSACTTSIGSDPAGAGDAAMAPVEQLIGSAACSADTECRTLALGAKACGGPLLYRAWSSRGTDSQALANAAARYTATQRARLEASGMASNCAYVADPGARCVEPPAANAASAGQMVEATGRCELARDRGNVAR